MHVQQFACFCVTLPQFLDFPVNDVSQNYVAQLGLQDYCGFYFVSSIEFISKDRSYPPTVFFPDLLFHFAVLLFLFLEEK